MTTIYKLDPLRDPRWQSLVDRHPYSSVFHTTGWLRALSNTYGYKPVVYTTSSPTGALTNGLLFCRVQSWLTGRRIVSLPFSDHCEPLCDSKELEFLIHYLQSSLDLQEWKYLELRPLGTRFSRSAQASGFCAAETHLLHRVNLQPPLEEVFRTLHKASVQRRVGHASRAGVIEKVGRSQELLQDFYRLFVLTRRRHHLPPQPYTWFRNLVECLKDRLEIRVAYQDKRPVATILTLRFREIVYYKYGGSDASFHHLGATVLLLWRAMCEAKFNGAVEFDLGRTGIESSGLITFKNHWVRQTDSLIYWKFPASPSETVRVGTELKMMKRVFSWMPDRVLTATGRLLYRHIG